MKMKYNILGLTLLAVAVLSCEKETSPEQAERFIKFYGDYLVDQAYDLAALDDGGFAICGVGTLPDLGERMMLILTDEYGNLRSGFPKYYPEDDLDMETAGHAVVPIRGGQGGFFLAGTINRPLEGSLAMQKDIFLVKVSSSGAESWIKTYGSVFDEVVLSAAPGLSSGFTLAGTRIKEDGTSALLVMRVEQEGDSIGPPFPNSNVYNNNSANFILNAGDRYICASTYNKPRDATGTTNATDIWALSFGDDLSPNAQRLTSGASDEKATCVIEDDQNLFLVLGNRNISGRSEIVVHQIETNDALSITNSVLLTTISESDVDLTGERMVKTRDGRYAIAGTREANGDRQIFLQFITSDYNPEKQIIFGAAGDQAGADIVLPEDGGMVLLGTNRYEESSMISLIRTNDTGDL